ALLLDRCEFRVPLIHDEIEQRVADALVGDMHHGRPLALALVMAELDVRHVLVTELGLELERADLVLGQADRVLPVAEVVDPFVEVVELANHQRLLLASDAPAPSMRSRASGADTMRALQTSSSALAVPTRRGKKKVPPQSGTSPSLAKTCPIDA